MEIVSHRGFWLTEAEKNSAAAFIRSAESDFGIETDVRDYGGELVIAHNMPGRDESVMSFEGFMQLYFENAKHPGYLAINIKADGLQEALQTILRKYRDAKYFVFDMSIPDTLGYRKLGINFFSRVSEYEKQPVLFEACAGIWLDAFHGEWYSMNDISRWLKEDKKVCLVSPELHKRDHKALWEKIKREGLHLHDGLLLCTDFPDKALKFFHEQ
jgi:hypothetical protein